MTTNETFQKLHDGFMKVAATGDEAAAKAYLLEHVSEFPADVQKKIVFAFFSDAVQKESDAITDRAAVQTEAMTVMGDIEKAEKMLDEKKKVADARAGLGM
jgi:hypothetical protein